MIVRNVIAALAALVLLAPVVATWQPAVPVPLRLVSLTLLGLSLGRPLWGLLVVAGLLPLATPIGAVSGVPFDGAQTIQLLAAPVLLGSALRALGPGRDQPLRLLWPALTLAFVIGASTAADLLALQQRTAFPADFAAGLFTWLTRSYYVEFTLYPPVHTAMTWWMALALAVTAEGELRAAPAGRRRLLHMTLVGGTAAAAFAAVRLAEISLRREDVLVAALEYLVSLRFNPHFGDLNAAGSFYVMVLVPAAILAARWRSRWLGAALPLLLLALWTSGSRAAMAAAVVSLALAWAVLARPSWRVLASGGLAAIVLAWAVTLNTGRSTVTNEALEIRAEMARVGAVLATRQPVFGFGLDRFRTASAPLVSPAILASYPTIVDGENAHNNYLQVLVELGLVGLAAFGWLLVAWGRPLGVLVARRQADDGTVALAAGLVAFLLTCLAGHPLLIPQVLLPFGLVLGLATGFLPPPNRGAGVRRVGPVLLLALVATVPVRGALLRADANLERVVIGATRVDVDDVPPAYRVDTRGRWFVDAEAGAVVLETRSAGESPACAARVELDGRLVDSLRSSESGWTRTLLPAPPGEAGGRWRTVDVIAEPPGCGMLVRGVRGR